MKLSNLNTFLQTKYNYLIFIVSFTGMVGSLFLSEVMMLEACSLCFVQRAILYPMVFFAGSNIILKREVFKPVLIFIMAILGILVALYHNYLQLVQIETTFCEAGGVSCSKIDPVYIFNIPFSIPFMSLTAFIFLAVILSPVIYKLYFSNNK
jgi:disulfide bond formation protein DsbB